MVRVVAAALSDIMAGLRLTALWWELAKEDIGDQHRLTVLGPAWILVNYLAYYFAFVHLFDGGAGWETYEGYVAIGLLVWLFIMETIVQGVALFWREESLIKGTALPISVFVLRLTMQSLIRVGFAMFGCIAILLFSGIDVSPVAAWSVAGLLLVVLTGPAAIIVVAFAGTLSGDVRFVISNAMRVAMFLTPVFWTYAGEGGIRGALYDWNPFTYFLEIVRAPILSGELPGAAFGISAVISLGMWALAILLLGVFRKRVAFLI